VIRKDSFVIPKNLFNDSQDIFVPQQNFFVRSKTAEFTPYISCNALTGSQRRAERFLPQYDDYPLPLEKTA
jgi:hypothetical protein